LYRRALQRAYIERLEYLLKSNPAQPSSRVNITLSDIRPMARQQLIILQTDIKRALSKYNNIVLKAHLNDALARIDNILNPKQQNRPFYKPLPYQQGLFYSIT